jgi:hypothetical protein
MRGMKGVFLLLAAVPLSLGAQGTVQVPAMTIHSPRVANQAPAGTFAMPVTALRFEPRVDLHGRNLAEGQADLTLRGGIFETTGWQLGALTVADPQTGHYLAEIPVAPGFLTTPEIATGASLVLGAANATTGAVAQHWRPVRTGGLAAAGLGQHGFRRADLHQGFVLPAAGSRRFGADVAVAHSKSDGARPFGDHTFDRANVRLQVADAASQTDLFAGYQHKRFGWPNLYTPFNSNESENLQTSLLVLNHRRTTGPDGFFEAGVYHRRNKDDYAFNRFAPLGPVHPFQHTTRVTGAAVGTRRPLAGTLTLNVRAEVLADELESTSLTFGRYQSRTLTRLALVPEQAWPDSAGARTVLKAGLAHDDSNRDGGAWSPVVELARHFASPVLRRVHLGYVQTTQLATYTALNSSATAGLFRGNPNLGRQRAHTLELGFDANLAGWQADAGVFWRRDDGLVDWTYRRGVTARTANPVDLDVGGLEMVARRSWSRADIVVGYTALTKSADYRGARVDASFYALNYARHRLTAALTLRLGRGFEFRFDNVARVQADNALRLVGGDEAIVSAAGLSYRPSGHARIEFSLQIDNLWNSTYQDVPAVPAAPRQISVGCSYGW